MTVQELIDTLQRMNPDDLVVVGGVTVPYYSIGPQPSAAVTRAYSGFDWENGTVRLQTDCNLVMLNDEQLKVFETMKKEASKIRNKNWEKRDKALSFEEVMEAAHDEKMDEGIHPLFKGNYKRIKL